MCPDYQMLSVYFDGELPSPWKEKMELHLGSCPKCRAQLEQFRRCSDLLRGPLHGGVSQGNSLTGELEAVRDRVWQNLALLDMEGQARNRRGNLWSRRISVPLPAAAAAGVILSILFFLTLARQSVSMPQNQESMTAAGMLDMPSMVPASNMHEVLQYLENQDNTDIVIIRLPESKNFSSFGEPTILKAADYSRRIRD